MLGLTSLLLLFAASALAGPFEQAEFLDASTLDVRVVSDWREIADAPARREKIVEITVAEWWPGRPVRIPVAFVAPPVGPAENVMVKNIGLRAPKSVRPDAFMTAMLQRGVGFVLVGIGPIEQMEPAEQLNDEMNRRFLNTKDVRYTASWLWGMSYMRALTAALEERSAFRPTKVGVTGGSKRGVASSLCGIWDERFTAIMPVVAPPYIRPTGLFPALTRPKKVEQAEARFWKALEAGKANLTAEEAANVKRLAEQNERYRLSIEQMRAAGWSASDIADASRRLNEMVLLMENLPAAHRAGFEYLYVMGTNDNVTPGVGRLARQFPDFPAFILPGGQHGSPNMGFHRPTPRSGEAVANELAFFSNHFFGDRPMPVKPSVIASRIGDELEVLVRFESGPEPESGELWWTTDLAPPGSQDYQYRTWRSVEMKRVSERGWTVRIPLDDAGKAVEIVSLHRDEHEIMPAYVSSNLIRVPLR